jgi:lysophospholipase L1-like esterase
LLSCFFALAQAHSSLFARYVALGDSLTAGYRSGGLFAAGQQAAYPLLIARWAGHPIAAPLVAGAGCPPPIGATGVKDCHRLDPTARVSDFAVPGAAVGSLYQSSVETVPADRRALYHLILRGRTQVQAAIRRNPTLITLWIGANNILEAAFQAKLRLATSVQNFYNEYQELLNLLVGQTQAQIVLFTIPEVTAVPGLIPGNDLFWIGIGGLDCLDNPHRISIVTAFGKGAPRPVDCNASYALTRRLTSQIDQRVRAYNRIIEQLAPLYGALVFHVGALLPELQGGFYPFSGRAPFGPGFSRDGIHPSALGQYLLARRLAHFLSKHLGQHFKIPAAP